jgi:hypothetical protein
MAETLGSLCDKLSIVKLKQYHSDSQEKLESLTEQELRLVFELNQYLLDVVSGSIKRGELTFTSNKIHTGTQSLPIGESDLACLISKMAEINCDLWHVQEKVYNFQDTPVPMKDIVVKQLAVLNLQRTECIDSINKLFSEMV